MPQDAFKNLELKSHVILIDKNFPAKYHKRFRLLKRIYVFNGVGLTRGHGINIFNFRVALPDQVASPSLASLHAPLIYCFHNHFFLAWVPILSVAKLPSLLCYLHSFSDL